MANDGKGPWDGAAENDGETGAAQSSPSPDSSSTNPQTPPRNPWDPDPVDGDKPSRKRGPALDDLMRRAGSGWSAMPRRPDGRSIWPLVVMAFALLWILSSSVHQLGNQEKGVITTFGKYSRTVGPGISFTLPAPIEHLEKMDAAKIRITAIGTPQPSSENLILTRDKNIIDMAYQVGWSIQNPVLYAFQLEDQEDTVKEAAESAMRASVSNFDFVQANGAERGDIEADVRARMQAILNKYKMGVLVQSVTILQSDPPAEVNAAFQAVNAAKQKRETNINGAHAYASQVIQLAEGETAEFDKIYEQYRLSPAVTKRRLYYETMEQVLSKNDKVIVETGGVTPYLPLPEFKKKADANADEVVVTGKKP